MQLVWLGIESFLIITFSTILSKKPFINRDAGFSSFLNVDIPIRKQDVYNNKEDFSTSCKLNGSAARAETTSTTQGLSKLQAQELVLRLNSEERIVLLTAIQEFQSKLVKEEYQGQLAASRWRSKYGRPAKLPTLGDVDPTGTYCLLPEDWLMKKCGTIFLDLVLGINLLKSFNDCHCYCYS
ncbi:uncharacterized protein LOC108739934 [Agrilus planipennis]|uniref:Uncharacterized protein LOC108739934 n=1 Tax=Agrilus planipennis TaxID=224129 RepID=A0A1W4XB51_AGRPL|nr:uncharacterized protein LOC108739934 [Agrilus planipennis]